MHMAVYLVISLPIIPRVGQNHIYTVYIRNFWLGNHGVYIRICKALANPNNTVLLLHTYGSGQP